MPEVSKRSVARVVGVIAGTALLGATCGVAYAVTQRDEGPKYEVNSSGETFGTVAEATSSASEPDLILATATNGKVGYVKKLELDEATGANVANPEEALAWQAEVARATANGEVLSIPVYESDCKTVIGECVIDTGSASVD